MVRTEVHEPFHLLCALIANRCSNYLLLKYYLLQNAEVEVELS